MEFNPRMRQPGAWDISGSVVRGIWRDFRAAVYIADVELQLIDTSQQCSDG